MLNEHNNIQSKVMGGGDFTFCCELDVCGGLPDHRIPTEENVHARFLVIIYLVAPN